MFGTKIKMGLASSIIPKNILTNFQTEEDLERVLTHPNIKSIEVVEIDEEIGVVKKPVEVEGMRETEDNKITDRAQKIKQHRNESHMELQKQATKMKSTSSKQMSNVLTGQTVKIKTPEIDTSKVDASTLLAVVLQVVDGNFYRLGIKAGTLSQLFTRNQFTLCEKNFLELNWNWNSSSGIITIFDWWTRFYKV
jgi:hypothetical protein